MVQLTPGAKHEHLTSAVFHGGRHIESRRFTSRVSHNVPTVALWLHTHNAPNLMHSSSPKYANQVFWFPANFMKSELFIFCEMGKSATVSWSPLNPSGEWDMQWFNILDPMTRPDMITFKFPQSHLGLQLDQVLGVAWSLCLSLPSL